jgi:hypothetical protein
VRNSKRSPLQVPNHVSAAYLPPPSTPPLAEHILVRFIFIVSIAPRHLIQKLIRHSHLCKAIRTSNSFPYCSASVFKMLTYSIPSRQIVTLTYSIMCRPFGPQSSAFAPSHLDCTRHAFVVSSRFPRLSGPRSMGVLISFHTSLATASDAFSAPPSLRLFRPSSSASRLLLRPRCWKRHLTCYQVGDDVGPVLGTRMTPRSCLLGRG